MSPFYFHLPPAPPLALMSFVPPEHATDQQRTLFRAELHRGERKINSYYYYVTPNNDDNNVLPARRHMMNNDGGADWMCSSSEGDGAVLVKKFKPLKKWSKGSLDSRFVINGDSRTTLMIKNIPNKYSLKLLLTLLDSHCAHCNDQLTRGEGEQAARFSSYDFVYLPMDFNNKCNVGYGFVNMTSHEATMRIYKAFHGQSWEVFNSRKICEVTYARLQGLETLKEHFKNSRFPSGEDEVSVYPVLFDPPRDGRQQLTPPQPIYGLVDSTCNGSDEQQSHNESGDN